MKQSGKVLALQAAELARKQEVRRCHAACVSASLLTDACPVPSQQRIHDERQAKKAELERQREAARRTAMQQQPPALKPAAPEMPAKLPPPAGAGSAAQPAPGSGSVAPVLPARLQQAMQVRAGVAHARAYLVSCGLCTAGAPAARRGAPAGG